MFTFFFSLQTIIDEMEAEINQIKSKYDTVKRICIARNRQITFLEAENASLKEHKT